MSLKEKDTPSKKKVISTENNSGFIFGLSPAFFYFCGIAFLALFSILCFYIITHIRTSRAVLKKEGNYEIFVGIFKRRVIYLVVSILFVGINFFLYHYVYSHI